MVIPHLQDLPSENLCQDQLRNQYSLNLVWNSFLFFFFKYLPIRRFCLSTIEYCTLQIWTVYLLNFQSTMYFRLTSSHYNLGLKYHCLQVYGGLQQHMGKGNFCLYFRILDKVAWILIPVVSTVIIYHWTGWTFRWLSNDVNNLVYH